jgi:hypothetical protein
MIPREPNEKSYLWLKIPFNHGKIRAGDQSFEFPCALFCRIIVVIETPTV